MKEAGFTAAELRGVGVSARKMLMRVGTHTRALFEVEELRGAGYTLEELRGAGLQEQGGE